MRILVALLLAGMASAAGRLTVRFIDVEGGHSLLIVSPSGESMLVDAGAGERDAQRIQKAVQAAGLTRLHYLLLTNFHRDHAGGVAALVKLVPIVSFLDHGTSSDTAPGADEIYNAYQAVARGRRRGVYAGDTIPLGAADVTILTANGDRISDPIEGGGQINLLCGSDKQRPPEKSEDTQSIGLMLTFGRFRLLDLSDLLWNQEIDLVCPVNRLGPVTAYVATHHGEAIAGSQTLVHAIHPAVAIVGSAKAASPDALKVLETSPGMQKIWPVNESDLVLSAAPTGEFTVTK